MASSESLLAGARDRPSQRLGRVERLDRGVGPAQRRRTDLEQTLHHDARESKRALELVEARTVLMVR